MAAKAVTIAFEYNGVVRRVANPKFKTGRSGVSMVVGFEIEKDGVKSGVVKTYRVDRITQVVA